MFPLAAEGLVLRPSDEASAAALCALLRHPDVAANYSLAHGPHGRELDALHHWAQAPRDWATHRRLVLAAHDPGDDTIVGAVRLDRSALSYFVDPVRWGRGHAGAMVSAVCDQVAPALGLTSLQAEVLRDNLRSRRVLERAGFRFAGLAQRRLAGLPASAAVMQFERAIAAAPDPLGRMTAGRA